MACASFYRQLRFRREDVDEHTILGSEASGCTARREFGGDASRIAESLSR